MMMRKEAKFMQYSRRFQLSAQNMSHLSNLNYLFEDLLNPLSFAPLVFEDELQDLDEIGSISWIPQRIRPPAA